MPLYGTVEGRYTFSILALKILFPKRNRNSVFGGFVAVQVSFPLDLTTAAAQCELQTLAYTIYVLNQQLVVT